MSEQVLQTAGGPPGEPSPPGNPGFLGVDWNAITKSPAFMPGVVMLILMGFAYSNLLFRLPDIWFAGDGYYSHGLLVPLISGYVIFKWWPKISQIEVKPFYPAIIGVGICLLLYRAALVVEVTQFMSVAFIGSLLFAIWFVAGGRWMFALAPATIYLLFMLPVWTAFVDNYTNPLQILSTEVAEFLLKITGFNPMADGSTVIYLNNFTLDVGVPCSGLKLILAVTAFTLFFVMIARLNIWGNMMMIALILPLCLFINGLRIMLIGVVGNEWGREAGMKFHDYSGYITLLVCFYLLFKAARILGWKD
jgi:exosortase